MQVIKYSEILSKYSFIKEAPKNNALIGRREELQFLKESLFKKRMKNTILIGNAGSGKSAILEQFAYDMRNFFKIVELDIASCVAGTSLRGQFEEKITNFLNDAIKYNKTTNQKIIIFIDEIHTLHNAGGSEGAVNASNILKSYLSRGEIMIIGATTFEEYQATIKKDKAMKRRLSPLFIKDLDDATNLEILKVFNEDVIDCEIVEYIYEKSKDLGYANPDISLEILDRCMAKKKYSGKQIKKTEVNKIIKYMKEV